LEKPQKAIFSVPFDDCLTLAKSIDREALGAVIDLLRKARNSVVVKQGQQSIRGGSQETLPLPLLPWVHGPSCGRSQSLPSLLA
jgi:hypothetical protein